MVRVMGKNTLYICRPNTHIDGKKANRYNHHVSEIKGFKLKKG